MRTKSRSPSRLPIGFGVDDFDVREEDGRVVLVPMPLGRADAVRARLEQRGITSEDVHNAVVWARGG